MAGGQAVRAIRNPERYGPRAANPNLPGGGPAQSRTAGLTRAILDTFPVVKFGGGGGNVRRTDISKPAESDSDLEMADVAETRGAAGDIESRDDSSIERHDVFGKAAGEEDAMCVEAADIISQQRESAVEVADKRASTSSSIPGQSPNLHNAVVTAPSSPHVDAPENGAGPAETSIDPLTVDDQLVCPICVDEWQDGDDIRILPCDGRHRFHRECIDPWLLNVSSLCPLCRWDLSKSKMETTTDGNGGGDAAGAYSQPGEDGGEGGGGHNEQRHEDEAAAGAAPHVPPASASFASNLRRAIWAGSAHRLSSIQGGSGTGTAGHQERTRFARYLASIRSGSKPTRRTSARDAAVAAAASSYDTDHRGPATGGGGDEEHAGHSAAEAGTSTSTSTQAASGAGERRGAPQEETEQSSSWLASAAAVT
jgi:hypothetical protein